VAPCLDIDPKPGLLMTWWTRRM